MTVDRVASGRLIADAVQSAFGGPAPQADRVAALPRPGVRAQVTISGRRCELIGSTVARLRGA